MVCLQVGNKLSMADITIYYWLTFFFDNTEGAKAAYAPCPTISSIVSTVSDAFFLQTHERREGWSWSPLLLFFGAVFCGWRSQS